MLIEFHSHSIQYSDNISFNIWVVFQRKLMQNVGRGPEKFGNPEFSKLPEYAALKPVATIS
jgi:hypothetical protein